MSSDQGYYDLSPDKQTLRSLRSDVTPITAVEELVDNVLDNWRRGEPDSDITIDIDFDFENEVFRIEDDSGGLSEENVKKIFALGDSTTEEIPNSIGSYGMGAKKAILRLGNQAVIKSRTGDAETAYGFVIDEEWLHSENWQVAKQEFHDVEPGSTVIRIEGLDIELQKDTDLEEDMDDDEETSNFDTPEEYLNSLREDLSETYDEFLKGRAGPQDGSVSIMVNGVGVEEQPEIDWAFTPYDGYHPRFYEQYEISPEEIPGRDEPITVDIIAGLMRTGESEKAGTDVIIQNRRVLTSDKTEMGGWGTHLPSFRQNLRRTRFIVKITAESHPESLPWDTQKDKIEPNSVITDRVFNILHRAGSDYTRVDYENFTTAYTAPYDSNDEGEDAEEWQGVQPFNYSDRQQFIADHKPDNQLPETNQIEELVEYHKTELGVFAPHIIAEEYVKGYRAAFDPSNDPDGTYEPDSDSVWIVSEEGERFPEQELHMILEAVKDTAERHARNGQAFDFGDDLPWWHDYYAQVLRENGSPVNTLDATVDLDGLRRRIEARGEEQDLSEPIMTIDHLHASNLSRVFSDGEVDRGDGSQSELDEHIEENSEAATRDLSEDDATEDTSDLTTASDTDPLGLDSDEDEENSRTESESRSDKRDIDFGTTTGRQSVQQRLSEKRSLILQVKESTYLEICDAVGLDSEEAKPREVGEAVIEQSLDIRNFVESSSDGG